MQRNDCNFELRSNLEWLRLQYNCVQGLFQSHKSILSVFDLQLINCRYDRGRCWWRRTTGWTWLWLNFDGVDRKQANTSQTYGKKRKIVFVCVCVCNLIRFKNKQKPSRSEIKVQTMHRHTRLCLIKCGGWDHSSLTDCGNLMPDIQSKTNEVLRLIEPTFKNNQWNYLQNIQTIETSKTATILFTWDQQRRLSKQEMILWDWWYGFWLI